MTPWCSSLSAPCACTAPAEPAKSSGSGRPAVWDPAALRCYGLVHRNGCLQCGSIMGRQCGVWNGHSVSPGRHGKTSIGLGDGLFTSIQDSTVLQLSWVPSIGRSIVNQNSYDAFWCTSTTAELQGRPHRASETRNCKRWNYALFPWLQRYST